MKRKRYFDWEQAFHFIWRGADQDGIWHGDAIELAAEFDVSEDTADSGFERPLQRSQNREALYGEIHHRELAG